MVNPELSDLYRQLLPYWIWDLYFTLVLHQNSLATLSIQGTRSNSPCPWFWILWENFGNIIVDVCGSRIMSCDLTKFPMLLVLASFKSHL